MSESAHTIKQVIEYLNKKGYNKTEAMLRLESANTDKDGRPLYHRLEDNGGEKYIRAFVLTRVWIDQNLDIYKPELKRLLWPLFVYSFLNLAADFLERDCERFFRSFGDDFSLEHEDDLRILSPIRSPEHVQHNVVAQSYRNNKYRISLSSMAYFSLIQFLESKEKEGGSVVISILQNFCNVVTVERGTEDPHSFATILSKSKQDSDLPPEDEGIPGHNPGSANTSENAPAVLPKIRLGPLPMESELMSDVQAELEDEDGRNPPAPGQNSLVEEFEKHIKREESEETPSRAEIPLPPSLARDVAMEVQKVKENRDRFRIDARTGGVGPGVSVCMYTFHNTYDSINCLDFSLDTMLVAAGMDESYIRVWRLDGKAIESQVPQSSQDTLPSPSRRLIGHSGPVYSVSFSPSILTQSSDPKSPSTSPRYLLSSSADRTVRLWSLDTWTCVVVYKGHDSPVWDVAWGPYGHYFLTGALDKTARLWSTDHISFHRIFAGHDQDVDTVAFHPNSAYVFTGSSDKTVRMWSVNTGSAVRLFTGHTGNLTTLACSRDGKILASADDSGSIILWDLASGRRIKGMRGHGKGGIWSLSWSVESSVLVSGGADGTVRVWDVMVPNEAQTVDGKVIGEGGIGVKIDGTAQAGASQPGNAGVAGGGGAGTKKKGKDVVITPDQISAFPTKKSPVYKVVFTRQNLVLAGGAYLP
ncbi:MAG: Transcription initiation factor TFIID subunit 5 [Sclerophora amabilis]|nr:MAG: Transcription initiation factor TFIID subunit 5 [Sclerophora amabilis]